MIAAVENGSIAATGIAQNNTQVPIEQITGAFIAQQDNRHPGKGAAEASGIQHRTQAVGDPGIDGFAAVQAATHDAEDL